MTERQIKNAIKLAVVSLGIRFAYKEHLKNTFSSAHSQIAFYFGKFNIRIREFTYPANSYPSTN